MRILWKSNAPWAPTGYGTQANSLLPRLYDLPEVEDIALFCYYGIQGAKTRLPVGVGKGITKRRQMDCYPLRTHIWGNDVVQDHALDFKADIVITLMDIWVLDDDYGNRGFRWVPYLPIDMDPPPPPVVAKMRHAYKPIVYSQFAQRWCERLGIESTYIPLGVETKIYKPYAKKSDKAIAKELIGFNKDHFVVGVVAANKGYPPRKGFPELFEAFKRFHEKHLDARLYVHSLITTEYGGADLLAMADAYGIRPWVKFVDPYKLHLGIDTETMNMIYNAMDVFCLPSRGEGFGVPLIEAQAAGVPVITTDYTSMTELVGPGWLVPTAARDLTPLGSWYAMADIGAVADAMDEAYNADLKEKSTEARAFALNYDWDALMDTHWKPFVSSLAQEIHPRTY